MADRIRLLQVMAGAEHGGAETAFADMCIALQQSGEADVTAVTRPHTARVERLRAAGVPVITLPFGGKLDLWTRWKLRGIIRSLRPQIVQTWMSRAAEKTPVSDAIKICRLGGYYKLSHFPGADYFTTITPDIREWLIRQGVHPDRVLHINNFAETEDSSAPLDRAGLLTPKEAFLWLALGRLHTSKAFDVLLEAMTQLPPKAHLWIAGEGPERNALQQICLKHGLIDRVRILGWRDDRAALLSACDGVVFPSRYEPFGTVFVQAWAAGKPLVTTASDGPRQYVRDGDDALLVPVEDAASLAKAMNRVMEDADLRTRMVENGRQRYLSEFTKQQSVRAYLDLYRDCLARKAAGSAG